MTTVSKSKKSKQEAPQPELTVETETVDRRVELTEATAEATAEATETVEATEPEESMKEKFERLIEYRQLEIRRHKEEILYIKSAYKQYTAELKKTKRRRKVEGPPKMNGFSKPTELHSELYEFLKVCGIKKGELVPRTKVTSCIHKYIKDNSLGHKENKKEFVPDKRLKKLLGAPLDRVDPEDESKGFFYSKMGLQKYINQYYPKKKEEKSIVL
jgi:chromatin remodeling complex protein RSC6